LPRRTFGSASIQYRGHPQGGQGCRGTHREGRGAGAPTRGQAGVTGHPQGGQGCRGTHREGKGAGEPAGVGGHEYPDGAGTAEALRGGGMSAGAPKGEGGYCRVTHMRQEYNIWGASLGAGV
jgi:hypothetical protein